MSASQQHNPTWEYDRNGGACPDFDDLSAHFDGRLSEAEASIVAAHVPGCAACMAILDDFTTIRSVLRSTTPTPRSRTFQLSEADAGLQSRPIERDPRKIRPVPLYPGFAGLAAVLLLSLIAGELLINYDNSTTSGPESANEVLFIDGTPYGPDGTIYNSASAGEMNVPAPDNGAVGRTSQRESDPRFLTGWRVAQFLSLTGFVFALGLWYLKRDTAGATIRR